MIVRKHWRRFAAAFACVAAAILVSVSVSAETTSYFPVTVYYGVPTSEGLPNNGIAMDSYKNGDKKVIQFYYTDDSLGVLFCSSFVAPEVFTSNETYMFKLSLAVPVPSKTVTDSDHAQLLKTINNSPGQQFNWSARERIYEEQGVQYEAVYTSSNYTLEITFSNIPWSSIKSYATWGIFIPKSMLYSSGSSSSIPMIVQAVYFGAESGFNQDRFSQAALNNLDDIKDQLAQNGEKIDQVGNKVDQVGGKVDEVGNKVDAAGDKISNSVDGMKDALETQPQAEIDLSKTEGDSNTGKISGALEDSGLAPSSGNILTLLNSVINAITTNDSQTYIDIPEVVVPSIAGNPSFTIIEAQRVDLSQFLNTAPIQQMIAMSHLLYILFFIMYVLNYIVRLFNRIFMRDFASEPVEYGKVRPDRRS